VTDSNAIPTVKPMFSGSSNPTVIPTIPSDLTGSDKSKIAAANPEVLISPLVHMIATQFQRLNLCFRGPVILHVVRFGIMFMGKGCLQSLISSRHFVLEQSSNYLRYYGVHLDFQFPLWCGNVGSGATELPDPENVVL